jgi:2-dehydro-3-deoxyglucarate aldolase/4-hydroxy-2-oxoheptanedioate aldolase
MTAAHSQASNFKTLRDRLTQGEPIGLYWMSLGSVSLLEVAGAADGVVIDMQHGLWDRTTLEYAVAALAHRAPVLVRTAENSAAAIGQALDAGAEAVIVPLIDTAEQAAQAAAAARFPPRGARSAGGVRPLAGDFGRYVAEANERILLGVMIETGYGVQNAAAIAATPGVDFILIGAGDLSISLGAGSGQTAFETACATVLRQCREASLPCAIYTGTTEAALMRLRQGFAAAVIASDIDVVKRGFSQAASAFRDGITAKA